jgi:hypothetical protein
MLYLEKKKMYPTPNTNDGATNPAEDIENWEKRAEKKKKEGINLHYALRHAVQKEEQMKMYPTPVAKDNCTESLETWEKRAEKHKAQGKTIPKALRIQVQEENKKIYNTPTTNDHKNTSFPKSQKNRHSIVGNLMQEKNPPKVGGRLNPQFVQFLMGYPIDWTKIE